MIAMFKSASSAAGVGALVAVVVAAASAALGCRADRAKAGESCSSTYDCERPLTCFQRQCRERAGHGEACDPSASDHCGRNLLCAPSAACRTPAERNAEIRAVNVAREEALMRESGIDPSRSNPEAEPVSPGAAVRVAETSRANTTFAACREDERLVGGGCRSKAQVRNSYPSNHSPADTLGARWNCALGNSAKTVVTAFALCQRAPATTQTE